VERQRGSAGGGARFAVRFNDEWWRRDMIVTDSEGRAIARRTRSIWEADGVAATGLHGCLPEARDGMRLRNCVKAYLGAAPNQPYGAVLVAEADDDGIFLRYLAFGQRHPEAPGESVYQTAHRRLNS
jgi:hypothetical protein